MNNSTVNFTTADASTTFDFGLVDSQGISVLSICLLFGLPTHSYVYGSSLQEQEMELHPSSSISISLFVKLVTVLMRCLGYCHISV